MAILYFVFACLTYAVVGRRVLSSPAPLAGTSWHFGNSGAKSNGHISKPSKTLATFLFASRPAVTGLGSLRSLSSSPRLRPLPTLSTHASNLKRRRLPKAPGIRMAETRDFDVWPLLHARDVIMSTERANGTTMQMADAKRLGMEILQDVTPEGKKGKKRGAHDDIRIRRRKGRELPIPQVERYKSSDWKHILAKTPSSVVLKRTRGPIVANMVWAAIVWGAYRFFGFPAKFFTQAHSLIGSALGLLLVFRTNAAYQRFWEGRIIWENLHGYARGLSRMSMMYEHVMPREKVKRIANLICVFSTLLAEHLGYFNAKKIRRSLITPEDRIALERSFNRPLWAINTLGREIREIPDLTVGDQALFSSRERLAMLSFVNKMCEALGKCERLVQTPVPLNYARHTARFLAIWCFTLPFALAGGLGLAIVPAMGLMSWLLYGIQEIGLMIEDPFRRSLHLDIFLASIYSDVMETTRMIGSRNATKKASL